MSKHSPLPWASKFSDSRDFEDYEVYDTYDNLLCVVDEKPDADLIVRAVNSHDKLVEACKLAINNFERSDASGNFLGDDDHEAWTALTEALASVEVK